MNSPNLEFRREPVQADLAAVREMLESTDFFYPDEVDIAVELIQERLDKGDASGYHFVFATRDGAPAGYSCFGPVPATRGSYDVYWVAVHKNFQRSGLGAILMRETESDVLAMGGKRIYVDTSGRELYDPTRRFYLAMGYKAEAVLKDFYAEGDSKYIFSKELKP